MGQRAINEEVRVPTYPCFVCGTYFKMGHGAWHGTYIAAWKLTVCDACHSADGIVPDASVLTALAAAGVTPTYNEDGYVAWPNRA